MSGKKCVIYCRTSTDKQETGLDTQYFDCRTQVSRIGLELLVPTMEETTVEGDYDFLGYTSMPGGFFDEGQSGGLDPMERPGFSTMMNYVRDNEIELIVMYHNDRLARDVELTLRVVRECKQAGIEFYLATFQTSISIHQKAKCSLRRCLLWANISVMTVRERPEQVWPDWKAEGRWLGATPYGFYAITKHEDEENYGLLLRLCRVRCIG